METAVSTAGHSARVLSRKMQPKGPEKPAAENSGHGARYACRALTFTYGNSIHSFTYPVLSTEHRYVPVPRSDWQPRTSHGSFLFPLAKSQMVLPEQASIDHHPSSPEKQLNSLEMIQQTMTKASENRKNEVD